MLRGNGKRPNTEQYIALREIFTQHVSRNFRICFIEPDGTVVREWNHAEARVMCGFHRVVKVLPGRKKVAK